LDVDLDLDAGGGGGIELPPMPEFGAE
jgi:hypothetical protein